MRLMAATTMAAAMVASSEPRRIMKTAVANTIRTKNSSGGSPVASARVEPMPTLLATMIEEGDHKQGRAEHHRPGPAQVVVHHLADVGRPVAHRAAADHRLPHGRGGDDVHQAEHDRTTTPARGPMPATAMGRASMLVPTVSVRAGCRPTRPAGAPPAGSRTGSTATADARRRRIVGGVDAVEGLAVELLVGRRHLLVVESDGGPDAGHVVVGEAVLLAQEVGEGGPGPGVGGHQGRPVSRRSARARRCGRGWAGPCPGRRRR